MDYLETGTVVQLGARQTMVLSYLNSCVRETMTGATVRVGAEQSEVLSGKVERSKVRCDTGKASLTGELAIQVAGRAFRSVTPVHEASPAPKNQQPTIYGLSPLLEVRTPGVLTIERIDEPSEAYALYIDGDQLVRGGYYDFARWGRALVAGATYRATSGSDETVFKVDPEAKPGRVPVVSRLVRLPN